MKFVEKFIYPILFIKTLLAFVLTYNILTNPEDGLFLNFFSDFINAGNYLFCLVFLGIITIIHLILTIIGFTKLKKESARNYILKSSVLDVILLVFCFYFGIQLLVGSGYPFEDAASKIIINILATAIILYFINFIILIPYCIISKRGD